MFKTRPCGCKGLRSCKICEEEYGAFKVFSSVSKENSYVYCYLCKKLWPGWEADVDKEHPNHSGDSISFSGIEVICEFVTEEEEKDLVIKIDEIPWDSSQSGRLKQNYGPKCNFKKRKVTLGSFEGYPKFTKFLQEKFKNLKLLESFETVEQCSLEYVPERGSCIDPHIDDCWIWGERIPTISFLSDSVLTLTRFSGSKSKYNLCDAEKYPRIVTANRDVKNFLSIHKEFDSLSAIRENSTNQLEKSVKTAETSIQTSGNSIEDSGYSGEIVENSVNCLELDTSNINVIRIPMPRRSLLVLYGSARYDFEHCVLREDIKDRRVCITYREITPSFMSFGPHSEIGRNILEKGKLFWDHHSST